jgi:outer membrane protein assembly factor BamB
MTSRRPASRVLRLAAALAVATGLAGCSTLSSWMPAPPSFSWWPTWLGGTPPKTLPAAPQVSGAVNARVLWQVSLGAKSGEGFAPAITDTAVYAAGPDGTLAAFDPRSGAQRWRLNTGKRNAAGPGGDARMVVLGTARGEVLAYDRDGKPLWEGRVSSEVSSPPRIAGDIVIVWSGDGRIFGLSAADGSRRWVYQRAQPPLVVRNAAGGVVERNVLFAGTAGGRLLAIDVATGNVRWEVNVATPKGATELERIADVTSLPVVDQRQVCAVAFQGRLACFDVQRGVLTWSRDVSSLGGMVADEQYYYVTDDKGAIHALDKSTGASAWTQDKLAGRRPSGPQRVGAHLGVVDAEGRVYLLSRSDGALVAALATDGSEAVAQPGRIGDAMIWTSMAGNLLTVATP